MIAFNEAKLTDDVNGSCAMCKKLVLFLLPARSTFLCSLLMDRTCSSDRRFCRAPIGTRTHTTWTMSPGRTFPHLYFRSMLGPWVQVQARHATGAWQGNWVSVGIGPIPKATQ